MAILRILCLAFCAAHAAAQSAAFLSGPDPAALRVCVVDTVSGAVREVGAGQSDGPPVPSPDGAWIAYASHDGERRVIRLVKPDGSGARVLRHQGDWNEDPRWAHTGARLVYTSGRRPEEKRVAVYALASDAETYWGGDTGLGLMKPVFLPERTLGNILGAALTLNLGDFDIRSAQAEVLGGGMILAIQAAAAEGRMTTQVALVTKSQVLPPVLDTILPHKGVYEEWDAKASPDGRTISFESDDGGDRELYLLSFQKGVYNLTNHYEADWNGVWEPESDYLLFESFRGGRRGVYKVYADTVRVTAIAASRDADNWAPAPSPWGDSVLFVSNRGGTPDIWIAGADGADPRTLVQSPGLELAPAWIGRPEEDE